MNIEIWSDIACPFCYIGKQNLEKALGQFPHQDKINIEYKSFELDPAAVSYNGTSFVDKLTPKFGGKEQAKEFLNHLTQQAENVGLHFQLDNLKSTNTLDAHRLLKWAKTKGKDLVLNEKLLIAHFIESQDVGDYTTLAQIAETVGLNKEEALEVLNTKALYEDQVRKDQDEARRVGISGVPFFIFNQKYAVSGAQPAESFSQFLEKIWEEEHPTPEFDILSDPDASVGVCSDEGCAIPPKQS